MDLSWTQTDATRAVMAALCPAGDEARFVGGCVRDSLLGRAIYDVDIATVWRPEQTMERLKQSGIRVVPTGINHGTVTAIVAEQPFEITTLRKDVATDGRRATVAFSTDWVEDASRRDFTFNAMSLDLNGQIHDPFGGQADLAAGRVRFVGDADLRIREDYLRLLRYFRFSAFYGKEEPDEGLRAVFKARAAGLQELSGERIRSEMLRFLTAETVIQWLDVMAQTAVLVPVFGQDTDRAGLSNLMHREQGAGIVADGLRRFGVFARSLSVCRRFRLSNADDARVKSILKPKEAFPRDGDEKSQRRYVFLYGAQAALDGLLTAQGEWTSQDQTVFDRLGALQKTTLSFPLAGRDLLSLGVAPGPDMGVVLGQVRDWWGLNGCYGDHADCLAYARQLLD